MCLVQARVAQASTLSITRELRRMVGFHVVAVDDVRQSWRSESGDRFIQLRDYGLFKIQGLGLMTPPAFSEAIVFAKALPAALVRQYPGQPTRAYFEYRLLIDGEFYQVSAFS